VAAGNLQVEDLPLRFGEQRVVVGVVQGGTGGGESCMRCEADRVALGLPCPRGRPRIASGEGSAVRRLLEDASLTKKLGSEAPWLPHDEMVGRIWWR
jgi:hypothetical protein